MPDQCHAISTTRDFASTPSPKLKNTRCAVHYFLRWPPCRLNLSLVSFTMASVLVPVLYVIIVFGSLFVFSSYYRRRLASMSPEHLASGHSLTHTLQAKAMNPTSLVTRTEIFMSAYCNAPILPHQTNYSRQHSSDAP